MNKVEEYIRDYTRTCSNEMDFKENGKPTYYPWLTPDHTRAVAQIARQEVIDKACEWLLNNIRYYSTNALGAEYLCNDFRNAMEE